MFTHLVEKSPVYFLYGKKCMVAQFGIDPPVGDLNLILHGRLVMLIFT